MHYKHLMKPLCSAALSMDFNKWLVWECVCLRPRNVLLQGDFLWNWRPLRQWAQWQLSTYSFMKRQFMHLWWKPHQLYILNDFARHLCCISCASLFHLSTDVRKMTEWSYVKLPVQIVVCFEMRMVSPYFGSREVRWKGLPRGTSNTTIYSRVWPQMLCESSLLSIPLVVLPPCGITVNYDPWESGVYAASVPVGGSWHQIKCHRVRNPVEETYPAILMCCCRTKGRREVSV